MEPTKETDIPLNKLAEVSNKKEMREITEDRALRSPRESEYGDLITSSRPPLRGIRIIRGDEPPSYIPDFNPDEDI